MIKKNLDGTLETGFTSIILCPRYKSRTRWEAKEKLEA